MHTPVLNRISTQSVLHDHTHTSAYTNQTHLCDPWLFLASSMSVL